MPNWCCTTVCFYGDNEALNKLEKKIREAEDLEKDEWIQSNVDFSKSHWMGNIVLVCGGITCGMALRNGRVLPYQGEKTETHCRGTMIGEPVRYEDSIYIDFEEAGSPREGVYQLIADECGLSYDYIADEYGFDLFINTNPKIFDEVARFYNHIGTGFEKYYTLEDIDTLLEDLQKELSISVCSIDEAIRKVDFYNKRNNTYVKLEFYTDRERNRWMK